MAASRDLPDKILIIHSGGIGDLLLALPAMRVFRSAFPGSTLELMGRPERLSLVGFDLQAEFMHSVDQAGMNFFYLQGESLPPRLKKFFSFFGVALLFGMSHRTILVENLHRAGIRQVFSLPSFPPEAPKVHVADYLLEELKAAGLQGENSFSPLRVPEEAMVSAHEFFEKAEWKGGARILAIHPGSGSAAKNWPAENFAAVAHWAKDRAQILLILGPAEEGTVEIRENIIKPNAAVAKQLPLLPLAGVLKSCAAYLGNDSGITHLAAMLGLPTLALFGPTDPAVWGPRGPKVKVLWGRDAHSPSAPEERRQDTRSCPATIGPDQVIRVLAPFFQ